MSIAARIRIGGTIRETLESGIEFAPNPTVNHVVGGDTSFTDDTDPAGEKFSGAEYALIAGALTLDFTALTGINDAVDGSGLQPRWIYIENNGAADITIAKGASNGHNCFGTSWTITLRPGEKMERFLSDTGPSAIDGTHKTVDVTGTGTNTFKFAVIFG